MSTLTLVPQFSRPVRAPKNAPSAGPSSSRSGGVRLTRRGRLVVLFGFLALVLAVAVAFSAGSVATPEPGADVPTTTVVVSQGDTLWGIASEVAAPGEIREVVHQIEKLNSLSGSILVEGQELAVPTN